MNLAKLGLILDSKGRIKRPRETLLDLAKAESSTAREYGFEVADQVREALGILSVMSHQSLAPVLTKSSLIASSKNSSSERPHSKGATKKKKVETLRSFRQAAKKDQDLEDIDEDISKMDLKTLRKHFGYKNGKIKLGIFCRNVVWQIWRFTQAGKPPPFVVKSGNVRSLRYHVKTITETHTRSFGRTTDFHSLFGEALSKLTGAGLLSYSDLNFIDNNRVNRWVAPSYGAKNVVVIAEKRSFSEELLDLGKSLGVTVQCTGGNASRVTVETMLLEMAENGHDLTEPFLVFAMVDFDAEGWNVAQEFVTQMLELGLSKVRSFRPYGRKKPRQPWIDIVVAREMGTDFLDEQRHPYRTTKKNVTAEWLTATGGLYGQGGKKWALSSEAFLGYLEEHLTAKLKKFLPKDYQYHKIEAMRSLIHPLTNYAAEKLIG